MARCAGILVAACLLLGGGCTSESRDRVADGQLLLPAMPNALQGPGRQIGEGFSVVQGSRLVGDTFPAIQYRHLNEPIEGWDALLLVDDQPLRRLQRYLDQAEAAGYSEFSLLEFYGEQPCGTDEDERAPGSDQISPKGTRLRCVITARRPTSGGRFDRVSFALDVGRPRHCAERCWQSYASYIEISTTYNDPGPSVGSNVRPSAPDVASLRLPDLPAPLKELRLPRPGERVGADQDFFDGFEVERGSAVVAPGAGLSAGGTGGFSVLLRINGEPKNVLESYLSQFKRVCCGAIGSDYPSEVRTQRVGNAEQLYAAAGQSGGISISVITTPLGSDRPVFARVDVSSD